MASRPENYDEDLLEEDNDNFTVSGGRRNHRVVLESNSFIETESSVDNVSYFFRALDLENKVVLCLNQHSLFSR